MLKLLKHIKKYTAECIFGPLLKLLEALIELFIPLIVAAVIDKGIGSGDKSLILSLTGLMALSGLVGLLFSVTAQFLSAKAAVGYVSDLRSLLFKKIQSFSYSTLDGLGTSSLITRLTSDLNQIQTAVNLVLRLLLRSPFVVFGAMIMAFTVNTDAGLVFAVVIPILSVIIFGIMLYSIPLYRKVQNSVDKVLLKTRENLIGVRVIRAFCKEEGEIKDFDDSNKRLTAIQKFVGKISSLLNPLTFFIINAGVIALIYVGAIKVNSGILSQGDVVALYNYMSMILVELIKLASFIITVMKGVACGRRVQAVLDIEENENGGEERNVKGSALLEFKKVSFCYNKASENSLSDISFILNKGETLEVIGSTGSGKTTLVNLIPRFYEASEGEVLFEGNNVNNIPYDKLRAEIGVVPQKAVLFRGTVKDNLLWGNENASDEELVSALKTAQIGNMDLSREVSESGKNFSGGQKQRLTIARALVRRPKILILDDSTCALDFATDAALRAEIKKLDFSPAVVIVSQRTSSIAHADKILVLEDGEAVGFGTHEELIENCSVYNEIHTSQFKKEGE